MSKVLRGSYQPSVHRSTFNVSTNTTYQTTGPIGFERLIQAVSPNAFYNSDDRPDPPKCHENTRVAVIKKIMKWVTGWIDTDAFMLWLYGPAGAGKTAIACAGQSTTVPFLRAYSGGWTDHFYTTDSNETNNAVANLGFTAEGTTAYIFPGTSGRDGTVPLYRMFNGGNPDHFYTTSAPEVSSASRVGYTLERIAGYIYANANCGGVPLYRLYNGNIGDHFYTTSASERDNAIAHLGYADEGIAGYVLPA